MRSIRRIVLVAGVTLALTALAPSAAASSPKEFHLTKTCESFVLCTVATSSFKAIPAGTEIAYDWLSDFESVPTITVRNGTATGFCTWTSEVTASCSFGTGTGRLSQFHLDVAVTLEGDSIWHWDGAYWSGDGD